MTILLSAVIFLACKVLEELRQMRDIYNIIVVSLTGVLDPEALDKVSCALIVIAALIFLLFP